MDEKFIFLFFLSIMAGVLVSTIPDAFAATFYSAGSGFYDLASTWTDENLTPSVSPPDPTDDKFIFSGHIVTMRNPTSNSGLMQVNTGGRVIVDTVFTNSEPIGPANHGIFNSGIVNFTSNALVENGDIFETNLGETTLATGGIFNNHAGISNGHFHLEQGVFIVKGTLNNFGDIHQLFNGTMKISGGMVHNSGALAVFANNDGAEIQILENSGEFLNDGEAKLENFGLITINSGHLSNFAEINNKATGLITLEPNGALFNFDQGEILNEQNGVVSIESLGKLDVGGGLLKNLGEIENAGEFKIATSGIVNNTSSGTIDNTKTLDNSFGGTLNNEGTLDNHDKFDNKGTVDNKENATLINFFGGKITNNNIIKNDGKITNKDTITNTSGGMLNNTNYIENEKQIDNVFGGNINNTCLINNSGSVPNMGGKLSNDSTITNTGAIIFQPGGALGGSGTLNGNAGVKIYKDEIIPEDDKIKGRIVVSTPDRWADKINDRRGHLPLRGLDIFFTNSGGTTIKESDRMTGDFSFDVPTKKDTVHFLTLLQESDSVKFPNGRLDVNYQIKGDEVQFETENFNSCIRIAYLELSAKNPEFKLSGDGSTPSVIGYPIERLADLAAIYYYSLKGFEFLEDHLPSVIVDDALPLEVVGFSNDEDNGAHTNYSNGPSIHLGGETYLDNYVLSEISTGRDTETQIDVLYHEFGHYIINESRIGEENSSINTTRVIHPNLAGLLNSSCHSGYAQIDSSCAWSEGAASFLASVIFEKMLEDDPNHDEFTAHIFKYPGGAFNLHRPISLYGINFDFINPIRFDSLNEEEAVTGVLWGFYSPSKPEPSVSIPIDTLMSAFSNPAFNPLNDEIITNVFDLYTLLIDSNLTSDSNVKKIFGLYKICVDTNANRKCEESETHGETAWGNVEYTDYKNNSGDYLFGYPILVNGPNRESIPLFLPGIVSFNVKDLIGVDIMDGTKVIIETTSSDGEKYSYQDIVYDGKLMTSFQIPEGGKVTLTFLNEDYFSESIIIPAQQYYDNFGYENQTNALSFAVAMAPRGPCTPPVSGDWIVSTSCELTADTTISGNVIITASSVLDILTGNTLTITSGNNVTVELGSGLKIISGGTLIVIS